MTTYLMKMFRGLVVPMVHFSVNNYLKKICPGFAKK